MLTLTVAVPSTRRPLKVGSGSTNLGMVVPWSGVCATTVCATDVCATLVNAAISTGAAAGSTLASQPSARTTTHDVNVPQ